jgi:uncharacterized protein YegP (UPF0339 family)
MATYDIHLQPGPDGKWSFRVEEQNGGLTATGEGHSSASAAENAARAYLDSLAQARTVQHTTAT